jgi:DNA-binding response OmpR family regulator
MPRQSNLEASAVTKTFGDRAAAGPYTRPVRLLIVDDNVVLANAIRRLLEGEGAIECVFTVDDAIAAIDREAPDCMLVDLAMPHGGGQALFRWIRSTKPSLVARVIFMTGYSDEIARDAVGNLPNPVLLKPFRYDDVMKLVRAVVA